MKEFDIVYTWVNGNFPGYLDELNTYSASPVDLNPERYRDHYDLLKYSIRSLEKYFSGFRNIILFTKQPQVPEWLNIDHPRVRVVHHEDVMDQQYLPTFNPNVIESYLHKIPGLSEHFIYLNDDFLFGNTTNLEDFYPNGKYRIFNTFIGENLPWRIYDGKNQLASYGIIEHTPLFIKKSYWQEMNDRFPDKMNWTRKNKFRQPSDLMTYKHYRQFMLSEHREKCVPIMVWDLLKINRFHKITNDLAKQKKGITKLKQLRPKYYCLNDDQRDNPNPEVVSLIKDFLDHSYPEKSTFEKSS